MTIGERIKARRIALNMSAEELGQLIGKNRATIYRYENGDIESMPISALKPIADALRTTPGHLMGWGEIAPDLGNNLIMEITPVTKISDRIMPYAQLLKAYTDDTTREIINKILNIEKDSQ